MFQMTFAIITPALIAGAFADRMKFSAMLLFMGLWSIIVYARSATGSGAAASSAPMRRPRLRRRHGRPHQCRRRRSGLRARPRQAQGLRHRQHGAAQPRPARSSAPRCCGSAGSASTPVRNWPPTALAGMAMVDTQIATAAAALAWMFAEWIVARQAERSRHHLRCGCRPRRHHAGLGLRRSDRRLRHRHRRRRRLLLGGDLAQADARLRRLARRLRRARHRRHRRRAADRRVRRSGDRRRRPGCSRAMPARSGPSSTASLATIVWTGVASFVILKVVDMIVGLRVSHRRSRSKASTSTCTARVDALEPTPSPANAGQTRRRAGPVLLRDAWLYSAPVYLSAARRPAG